MSAPNLKGKELSDFFFRIVKEAPVIAILRGITPEEIPGVCRTLSDAGIRLLEIPLNKPKALECITLAAECAGQDQLVGAGTVLRAEEAAAVSAAGGKFVISPDTDPEVIRAVKSAGMVSMPGCFTATEALAACKAGADCLKLFPAGAIGPGYVKDLKAVVPLPFFAVGGVNLENAGDFLKCCAGIGIGSALYKAGKSPEAFRKDAFLFAEVAKKAVAG